MILEVFSNLNDSMPLLQGFINGTEVSPCHGGCALQNKPWLWNVSTELRVTVGIWLAGMSAVVWLCVGASFLLWLEAVACEGSGKAVQWKAGLGHSAWDAMATGANGDMPSDTERASLPGTLSQWSRGRTEWAPGKHGAVWGEGTDCTSSQAQWLGQNPAESRKPDLQALAVGGLQLRLCDGLVWVLGFSSFGRGASYEMWIWVQVTILLPRAIPGVQMRTFGSGPSLIRHIL